MSIFESLENLNVSEECFDDIMGIVEAVSREKSKQYYDAYKKMVNRMRNEVYADKKGPEYSLDKESPRAQKLTDYLKKRWEKVNYRPGSAKKEEQLLFRTESLENLPVSEECLDDIMGIVEEIISELKDSTVDSMYQKRKDIERKADRKADYAHTVGETALTKAKNSGDKEAAKNIQKFIDNADDEQRKTTSKRLKAQRTISNWARKMRNTNISFDANGHPHIVR